MAERIEDRWEEEESAIDLRVGVEDQMRREMSGGFKRSSVGSRISRIESGIGRDRRRIIVIFIARNEM